MVALLVPHPRGGGAWRRGCAWRQRQVMFLTRSCEGSEMQYSVQETFRSRACVTLVVFLGLVHLDLTSGFSQQTPITPQAVAPLSVAQADVTPQAPDLSSEKVRLQMPRYRELPDRTDELQEILNSGSGGIRLSEPVYRITRTLLLDLQKIGSASVVGIGSSTIVMDGAGPAILVKGTHQGTASPRSFDPLTWNQRMPVLRGFEIVGASEHADGIRMEGTVGSIVQNVSVRWCRHAFHLVDRNRNVIVNGCHFYENQGIGIYLDDVNLHQINVVGSHISYNQGGGIVVRDGNVRNLQVSGCDIEANMPFDQTPTRTANVWIDVSGSAEDRSKSIAEVSITGCTIQHSANYSGDEKKTVAPGGANIRLSGKEIYPIDSVTISGNVISDTTINLDLSHVMDVAIASNNFFAPKPDNIRVHAGNRVILHGNTFNPRQFVRPGDISFTDCTDCTIASSTLHQFATSGGAIRLMRCDGMSLSGLVISDCETGVRIVDCEDVLITGCLVRGTKTGADLSVDEASRNVSLQGNHLTGAAIIPDSALAQ